MFCLRKFVVIVTFKEEQSYSRRPRWAESVWHASRSGILQSKGCAGDYAYLSSWMGGVTTHMLVNSYLTLKIQITFVRVPGVSFGTSSEFRVGDFVAFCLKYL